MLEHLGYTPRLGNPTRKHFRVIYICFTRCTRGSTFTQSTLGPESQNTSPCKIKKKKERKTLTSNCFSGTQSEEHTESSVQIDPRGEQQNCVCVWDEGNGVWQHTRSTRRGGFGESKSSSSWGGRLGRWVRVGGVWVLRGGGGAPVPWGPCAPLLQSTGGCSSGGATCGAGLTWLRNRQKGWECYAPLYSNRDRLVIGDTRLHIFTVYRCRKGQRCYECWRNVP